MIRVESIWLFKMTMHLLGSNDLGIRAIYEAIVITFANAQPANSKRVQVMMEPFLPSNSLMMKTSWRNRI